VRFCKERAAATLQTTFVCCSGEKPKYDLGVECNSVETYLFLPTQQQLLVEYHVVVVVVRVQFHSNVIADMQYSYRFLLGFTYVTVLRTSMHLSLARSSCIVALIKWKGLV